MESVSLHSILFSSQTSNGTATMVTCCDFCASYSFYPGGIEIASTIVRLTQLSHRSANAAEAIKGQMKVD